MLPAVPQAVDMLPTREHAPASQADAHDDSEERALGVELERGASGPDILSNGLRGDDRTRPDILSPTTEECSPVAEGLFVVV